MQIVSTIGTIAVIAIGLYLLSSDAIGPDMRIFGWLLVIVGALGLLARVILARGRGG